MNQIAKETKAKTGVYYTIRAVKRPDGSYKELATYSVFLKGSRYTKTVSAGYSSKEQATRAADRMNTLTIELGRPSN